MAEISNPLIGHDFVFNKLAQLAQGDELPSAMLFVGPEGIGKYQAAKLLAQHYLCERLSENHLRCGQCRKCLAVQNEQGPDVYFLKPEGQSIKIESIRDLLLFVPLKPLGRGKFVIIDEAHLLTTQAANALLKILEEPPAQTFFILITARPLELLATVRSRCQSFRFHPLSLNEVRQVITQDPSLIDSLEEWMLRASEGRCGKVVRWIQGGGSRLRDKAFAFVKILLDPTWPKSFISIGEVVKDPKEAADLLAIGIQILRDTYLFYFNLKSQIIHSDRLSAIEEFAKAGPTTIVQLWQRALRFEADLESPMDLKLSIENLYLESRSVHSKSVYALD